ncbi:MAG: ISAs1 family transposase [Chloroflexi bacterium]|nr:ISAs1 family transposase [Chloroflexota bacterium]
MKTTISEHFESLVDPRVERTKLHPLINILSIALCGVLSGADDWVAIEAYGQTKRAFLGTFLDLTNGIPSHDTFARVFALLDPEQFQHCFLKWIQCIESLSAGEVVAIDGKRLCGSQAAGRGKGAINMVSAWATENRLVLGQRKVDDKSNEITAIPTLLAMLNIKDCIITIDAMGCQRQIAQSIVEQEADYVLALKGNQPELQQAVSDYFLALLDPKQPLPPCAYLRTVDADHGRIEIRQHWVTDAIAWLPAVTGKPLWPGLRSIGMIQAQRRIGQQVTTFVRYYLASLPADAAKFAHAARAHWQIENQLHWSLDVTFHEDANRTRTDYAPQNLAVLRHIALNLLQQERSTKQSLKVKRLRAAWDDHYLLKLLTI